jgi:hypothetical protein
MLPKTIYRTVGKISNKFTAGQKQNTKPCSTLNRSINSQNNRPSYENHHEVHKVPLHGLKIVV